MSMTTVVTIVTGDPNRKCSDFAGFSFIPQALRASGTACQCLEGPSSDPHGGGRLAVRSALAWGAGHDGNQRAHAGETSTTSR